MKEMIKIFGILGLFSASCAGGYPFDEQEKVQYQRNLEEWLETVDSDLAIFNSLAAKLTWKLSTYPDSKTSQQARTLGKARNRWRNAVCQSEVEEAWMTDIQTRKWFLLCRGPKFSDEDALKYLDVLGEMAEEYNSEVCLQGNPLISHNIRDFPKSGDCLFGEPDLERIMKRGDLGSEELKWIWLNWHDSVGIRIKEPFKLTMDYQNAAARNNGYSDIGQAWREELETPNLEELIFELYEEMAPLYQKLHSVVRHKLYLKYGPTEIDPEGPIPIHLLGNMWGQDWSPLLELFPISQTNIDLEKQLAEKNMTVKEMVLEAEDFYTSLGLFKMTKKFWTYSIFEQNANTTLCHGTAANLYDEDDFRILMCGKATMDDFYVIHHEMGHIEYYKAYQHQPAIFQDGTTTAFHESIGDAAMHAVMAPQHLHRLGIISDAQLLDNSTDLYLLLHQALAKIPDLPFGLVLDKYRWELFRGTVSEEQWNDYYWYLNRKYRGIAPPEIRSPENFDAGAKFHVPDNTPYVRYFMAGVLQMQIYGSLCEVSLNGNVMNGRGAMRRCDIYGAKNAGRKLLKMMEKGASVHWSEALKVISGTDKISMKPFLEYYKPVEEWLEDYIQTNEINVGW